VFDGATGQEVRSFLAYPGFAVAVAVAAGDVNGDGKADIITAAAAQGHVKVFDGASNAEVQSYLAYPGFGGIVSVAAGDIDGDGRADVLTGVAPGGPPHVKAFSGATGGLLAGFFAYGPSFLGGVRVGAEDVNGDGRDDILTGPGPGAAPHVKAFDALGLAVLDSFFALDPAFGGGVYVG